MNDQPKKNPEPFVGLFVLFMGIVTFSNVANRPRFAAYQSVDVVGLMGAGMCIGAAMVVLIRFWRRRGQ